MKNQLNLEADFLDFLKLCKIVEVSGVPVNFIGYEELLKVKAKAGRPQDLADIDKLVKRNKKK
jgi:predicted nucleotidyltransferase